MVGDIMLICFGPIHNVVLFLTQNKVTKDLKNSAMHYDKNNKKLFDSSSSSNEDMPRWEKSEYELRRDAKVAANQELLRNLGLMREDQPSVSTWTAETIVNHRESTKKKGHWELLTKWVMENSTAEKYSWVSFSKQQKQFPRLVKEYVKQHPELKSTPKTAATTVRLTRRTAGNKDINGEPEAAESVGDTRPTRLKVIFNLVDC